MVTGEFQEEVLEAWPVDPQIDQGCPLSLELFEGIGDIVDVELDHRITTLGVVW
jgi:hypothetical protein